MKVANLVGERFRQAPADCVIESHALMVRGGYIKQVGNGVFSLFTPARRITRKIEAIIREEMDRIGGQEVLFPVVMPAALWRESGRFESVGSELLRFKDRNETDMVLGMTHEEAAVHLVRDVVQSYVKYPFMIYQIQTKFRDEPRSRGGLIRVREFTMKDGYSFHTTWEDLESYYQECYRAYERIFARAGVPDVVAVKSDSGMMGGSVSHEFMMLTDIGEDTLAICPECGYKSNMEAADCVIDNAGLSEQQPLAEAHTPGAKTIEEVCRFLGADPKTSMKAVLYQKNASDDFVVVFIRGDLEVNETKLRNFLGEEIHPAANVSEGIFALGFIGPKGLDKKHAIVFDSSLEGIGSLVCGANKPDYHYTGFNVARDYGKAQYVNIAKTYAGAICPVCGKSAMTISKGIEIGNIFQLGTKYSKAMELTYHDANGQEQYPIMGCYGIGVGRLAASVCQNSRDEYGPIWPMSIAPWQVQICALRADDEAVRQQADALYVALEKIGVEVLYDDRNIRAGNMFSDADLLGVPIRVVVSPKTLERGCLEMSARDKSFKLDLPLEGAAEAIREKVQQMLARYNV